jgi:hypothetical protein
MALAPPRRQQHSSAQNNILVVNYVREARFCRAFFAALALSSVQCSTLSTRFLSFHKVESTVAMYLDPHSGPQFELSPYNGVKMVF